MLTHVGMKLLYKIRVTKQCVEGKCLEEHESKGCCQELHSEQWVYPWNHSVNTKKVNNPISIAWTSLLNNI